MDPSALEGWPVVSAAVFRAVSELLQAYDYAQDAAVDIWQFAIEWPRLRRQGLTRSDVRWLLARRFVEHAQEITTPDNSERHFRKVPPPLHPRRMCLVLTDVGCSAFRGSVALLRAANAGGQAIARPPLPAERSAQGSKNVPQLPRLPGERPQPRGDGQSEPVNASAVGVAFLSSEVPTTTSISRETAVEPRPHWNAKLRELKYLGETVKRFRVPAANQELLLCAFEEEGWPESIDDPLPVSGEIDPKRRLQATIKCLNRNQIAPRLHFRGNGTGERITWTVELAAPQAIPTRSCGVP